MADRFDLINFGKSVVTTLGGTTANVNIDANTLFIDGTNNRVGVGTSTPTAALQVAGDIVSSGTIVPGSSFIRNRFINGAMEIAQRGTSGGTFGYLVDRWVAINTTAQSRSSDAPAGFIHSIEFTNSGTSFPLVAQRIERINSYDLAGRTVTLSFWARNVSGSANLFIELHRANSTDVFSSTTNELNAVLSSSPSASWTFYSTTFTVPVSATTGIEIRIIRNNASASTTRVTGVQLEVGSVATPFERRQFGDEFALCQRYFQRNDRASGIWYNGNQFRIIFPLPVRMRANVGEVILFDSNGYHEHWNATGYNGISAVNLASGGVSSVDVQITSSSNRGRTYNDPAMLERDVLGFNIEL